jgi:predicted ferric reductase
MSAPVRLRMATTREDTRGNDARPPLWAAQPTREGVVAGLIALGAIGVIALWWVDTPAGSLHRLGDELTAAGRITGLVGTYLLVVAVLLAGRIPWLDRAVGMDRLTVWHGRVGQFVVALLSAHAVATIVGYALTDRISLPAEVSSVVLHYPDVLSATVALVVLVAVGALSARVVRPAVAYHTWYFVHLYVYLATVLAFAHQLATGNEFVGHAWNRAFWIGLHVSVAGLLLNYRVIAPLRSALRHKLRVSDIVREGPDVTSVYFTGDHLDELGAEAGQFFVWRFLTRSGWWRANPYSLSAAPDGRSLRITVKDIGDSSSEVAALRPGTRAMAEGPYGNVTARRRRRRNVVLVAGGIGVAPLRAIFESMPARGGELAVLYRASTDADFVLRDELDHLARIRGDRVTYIAGPRHHQPFRRDLLVAAIPDIARRDAFVFGAPGFVDHAVAALRAAGVPARHIHAERFEF